MALCVQLESLLRKPAGPVTLLGVAAGSQLQCETGQKEVGEKGAMRKSVLGMCLCVMRFAAARMLSVARRRSLWRWRIKMHGLFSVFEDDEAAVCSGAGEHFSCAHWGTGCESALSA